MRSNEPRAGAPANGGRDKDLLAELARLTGQDDPYAALGHPGGWARPRPKSTEPYEDAQQTLPQWLVRSDAARRQTEPDPGYKEQAAGANPHHYEAANEGRRYQNDLHYAADDPEACVDEAYGQGPHDAESYKECPAGRRHGGIVMLAAVAGAALIGTAGIFGYQALTGLSGWPGEPLVVKAEQTPTKLVQVAPSTAPVDSRDAVGAAAPATAALASAEATGSVLPTATAAPPGLVRSGPKKVKTETIQPNPVAAPPPASPPAPVANMAPPAPASAALAARPISIAPARAPNAETGKYVVQVAAQRSEADAEGSLRALQHKYQGVLGSYQVMVRRADLGDKGVYYRAQVGQFATAKQANEVCSSLKSAGGQCIVQKN